MMVIRLCVIVSVHVSHKMRSPAVIPAYSMSTVPKEREKRHTKAMCGKAVDMEQAGRGLLGCPGSGPSPRLQSQEGILAPAAPARLVCCLLASRRSLRCDLPLGPPAQFRFLFYKSGWC